MPGVEDYDPFLLHADYRDSVEAFYEAMGIPHDQWTFVDPPAELKKYFIKIPVTFLQSFRTDLVNSLKEVMGYSTKKVMRLFYSKVNWHACIDSLRHHPFKKRRLSVSTASPENEMKDMFLKRITKFSQAFTYFLHIDQSISGDATGVAMAHVETDHRGDVSMVIVDFMVQIVAPAEIKAEIDIAKIRDFVLYIRDWYGIRIGKVTYDQYASRESLQHFRKKGIEAELQSVDRDDTQYVEFAHCLNRHMISMYEDSIFEEEFFNLIHDRVKRKVNHDESHTKDVSDAVVGACYSAMTNISSGEVPQNDPKLYGAFRNLKIY